MKESEAEGENIIDPSTSAVSVGCRHVTIHWDASADRNVCDICGFVFRLSPTTCSHPSEMNNPIDVIENSPMPPMTASMS